MTTTLREAAQQALEAMENCSSEYGHRCNRCDSEVDEGGKVASALRAALAQQAEPKPMSPEQRQRWEELAALAQQAEPQNTHSAECYQWHHKCAIAEVERLRAALATVSSDCPDSRQPEPPKASAAGHGMAWPGLASSGLARSSQTGNGGQR